MKYKQTDVKREATFGQLINAVAGFVAPGRNCIMEQNRLHQMLSKQFNGCDFYITLLR